MIPRKYGPERPGPAPIKKRPGSGIYAFKLSLTAIVNYYGDEAAWAALIPRRHQRTSSATGTSVPMVGLELPQAGSFRIGRDSGSICFLIEQSELSKKIGGCHYFRAFRKETRQERVVKLRVHVGAQV